MKRIILIVLLIVVLALAGCTRSASRPTDDSAGVGTPGEGTSQIPFPTPESGGEAGVPDEMSTAVAGGFATQTAIASGGQGQEPEVPAATTEVEPTAVPPTAVPTEKPADTGSGSGTSVDCSSPYKVKQGDWVWDIGRRCNIHPDSIIAANNLRWPYLIYPGDQLVLPSNAPAFPGP